jgi:hypothetical protein
VPDEEFEHTEPRAVSSMRRPPRWTFRRDVDFQIRDLERVDALRERRSSVCKRVSSSANANGLGR